MHLFNYNIVLKFSLNYGVSFPLNMRRCIYFRLLKIIVVGLFVISFPYADDTLFQNTRKLTKSFSRSHDFSIFPIISKYLLDLLSFDLILRALRALPPEKSDSQSQNSLTSDHKRSFKEISAFSSSSLQQQFWIF